MLCGTIMATQFGLLARFDILQDVVSWGLASMNPAVIHNIGKYLALKKVHYLTAIEHLEGAYLEFGVFNGSSFCHSIRCCRSLASLNPRLLDDEFVGFDSFGGFGNLADDEKHPFYTDANFATSLSRVERRARRAARGKLRFRLVPGFFRDSLACGAAAMGLTKARVIFIDSDTFSSASEALTFCEPLVQEGTYIVLDDYFSYRGSRNKGVAHAFNLFVERCGADCRQVVTYGMGGVVWVVSTLSRPCSLDAVAK
jgi:hypothetical protein